MNRTAKLLAGVLVLSLVAVSAEVSYGLGEARAKRAWADGFDVCIDPSNGVLIAAKSGNCWQGARKVELATTNDLQNAVGYLRDHPAKGATGAQGPQGLHGPQGLQGEKGDTGSAGSSSGVGGSAGCSLSTFPDLSNQDFADCSFVGLDLHRADWSGANLTNAVFSNIMAPYSTFVGANLTNVKIVNSTFYCLHPDECLHNATVTGADLSEVTSNPLGSVFGGTHIIGLDSAIIDAKSIVVLDEPTYGNVLLGFDMSVPGIDMHGLDESQKQLNYGHLSHANLAGTNFAGAYLYSTDFSHANLSGANFTNANLSGSDFTGANLTGANTTGVTWGGATCPDGVDANTAPHSGSC